MAIDLPLNVKVSAFLTLTLTYSQTAPTPGEYAILKICLLTPLFIRSIEKRFFFRIAFVGYKSTENGYNNLVVSNLCFKILRALILIYKVLILVLDILTLSTE